MSLVKNNAQPSYAEAMNAYKKEDGWKPVALKVTGVVLTIIFIISALTLAGNFIPALSSFTNLMGFMGAINISAPAAAISFILATVCFSAAIYKSKTALKRLNDELDRLGKQLSPLSQENVEKLKKESGELSLQIEMQKGELSDLQNLKSAHQHENSQLVENITNLKHQIDSLQSSIEKKKNELEKFKKDFETVQESSIKDKKDIGENIESLKKQISDLEDEKAKQAEELNTVKTNLTELKRQQDSNLKELESGQQELKIQEAKFKQLLTQLELAQAEERKLNTQNEQKREEAHQLQLQITDLESKVGVLSKNKEELEKSIKEQLSQQVDSANQPHKPRITISSVVVDPSAHEYGNTLSETSLSEEQFKELNQSMMNAEKGIEELQQSMQTLDEVKEEKELENLLEQSIAVLAQQITVAKDIQMLEESALRDDLSKSAMHQNLKSESAPNKNDTLTIEGLEEKINEGKSLLSEIRKGVKLKSIGIDDTARGEEKKLGIVFSEFKNAILNVAGPALEAAKKSRSIYTARGGKAKTTLEIDTSQFERIDNATTLTDSWLTTSQFAEKYNKS